MGGHVYRYYNLEYMSPTIGLYIYTPDYIRFLQNFKWYIQQPIKFIDYTSSKYRDDLILHGNTNCPIGVLHDIEIIFLHYKSEQEALSKWERRKQRINWNNLYIKMTQQNLCTEEHLVEFDELDYEHKFVFTANDYGLKSQVIFTDYLGGESVLNDTVNFRKFVNLTKFFNGKFFKKKQPRN